MDVVPFLLIPFHPILFWQAIYCQCWALGTDLPAEPNTTQWPHYIKNCSMSCI